MFGFDLLTVLLVVGLVVLVISTTVMILTTSPARRERRDRRDGRDEASSALSPSAQHALALARARAAAHSTEAAAASAPPLLIPAGQIIDISDGPLRGRGTREMTVEDAQALAEHVAETDPQFVAEVISQWIRADSSGPDVRP